MLLDTFGRCSNRLGRSDRLASGVTGPGGLIAQGTRSNRPGLRLSELLLFGLHMFRGSLHLLRGSFHEFSCVQGELFRFIALLVLLFVYRWRGALLASPVRSRYELCFQVILCLSCVGLLITCGACVVSLLIFLSFSYSECVCCQCTHQGGD